LTFLPEVIIRKGFVERGDEIPIDLARFGVVHLSLYRIKESLQKSSSKDIRAVG